MHVPHPTAFAPVLLLSFLGACASNPDSGGPGESVAAPDAPEVAPVDGAPMIAAASDVFVRPLEVSIATDDPDLVVRFTVDGTDPAPDSTRYYEPIFLGDSTLLRARSFRDGVAVGSVAERTFRHVEPHASLHAVGPVLGLLLELYAADELTDSEVLEALEPVAVASVHSLELPDGGPEEGVVHRFAGYVNVAGDGIYVVTLEADDSARVSIAGELIEASGQPGSATMHVALRRGTHRLVVEHFNGVGERALELRMGPLGATPSPIAPLRFTRDGVER